MRVKDNLIVKDCPLPPLYALRKDHKTTEDHHTGPPTRPVCGAALSYSNPLSTFVCMILNQVYRGAESICQNTEEMLAEFDAFNSKDIKEEVIIGYAPENLF